MARDPKVLSSRPLPKFHGFPEEVKVRFPSMVAVERELFDILKDVETRLAELVAASKLSG